MKKKQASVSPVPILTCKTRKWYQFIPFYSQCCSPEIGTLKDFLHRLTRCFDATPKVWFVCPIIHTKSRTIQSASLQSLIVISTRVFQWILAWSLHFNKTNGLLIIVTFGPLTTVCRFKEFLKLMKNKIKRIKIIIIQIIC